MNQNIKSEPTSLKTGVIWNLASLGFLALAGLVLNFAIARFYGSEALGVFNIAFALYIFASQFGVFGVHFSVLQKVSELYGKDPENVSLACTTAMMTSLVISTLVTLICFFSIPLIADFYGTKAPGIDKACYVILPGLWAFSLNKPLFNIINGARHMRIFAVLQAARYVFMLFGFVGLLLLNTPGHYLAAVFSFSELALLPILYFFASKVVGKWKFYDIKKWSKHHLWFGSRVFLSGAVLELNTRVDVLMIAYFLNADHAGVYTIAALVAEGTGRAVFAVRNNINPILTKLVLEKKTSELLKLSRKSVVLFTPFMALVSIVAYFVYPVFCKLMFNDPVYLQAHTALLVLLSGITVSSGLLVFNMILSQAARPASHTLFIVSVLLVNIVCNLIFVPKFGITGAAMGTAASYLASGLLIIILSRYLLKVRIVL